LNGAYIVIQQKSYVPVENNAERVCSVSYTKYEERPAWPEVEEDQQRELYVETLLKYFSELDESDSSRH
jgi:hypothetical protein